MDTYKVVGSVVSFNGDDSQVSRIAANEIGDALANGDKGRLRAEDNGEVVVVIDPGHDATHAGARANGLRDDSIQAPLTVWKYVLPGLLRQLR